LVGRALRLEIEVRAGRRAPWHPGRCAEILLDGAVVGNAGELHPKVCAAFSLPPRSSAGELDLSLLLDRTPGPVAAPTLAAYPVGKEDVALVVDQSVPAAAVEAALRDGAGELLESLRLFDVYVGDQAGAGKKSLAYSLRLRARDRTLTEEEIKACREAAVAEAARRVGAVQRV
jgi:phenylalanyl-tRNA synthetase beta chain